MRVHRDRRACFRVRVTHTVPVAGTDLGREHLDDVALVVEARPRGARGQAGFLEPQVWWEGDGDARITPGAVVEQAVGHGSIAGEPRVKEDGVSREGRALGLAPVEARLLEVRAPGEDSFISDRFFI